MFNYNWCYLQMFEQETRERYPLPGGTSVPRLSAERRGSVPDHTQGTEQVDDRRISRQLTEAV